MITVTEVRLDGTRVAQPYPDYKDYRIDPNDGSLTIWKANVEEDLAPVEYVTYVKGSFIKVHRS